MMPVKSIILMRHAEREDRAAEAEGKDWISTAPRPQDPLLSEKGLLQASEVGRQLRDRGVSKILCSPMIRTVQSANCVAEQLGLGENSICVEFGLVEEAKSFRGKTAAERLPVWDPIVLPIEELCNYSPRIDRSYKSLVNVEFIKDETQPNHVREVHEMLTVRDEVTRDRTRQAAWKIVLNEAFADQTILCVGHGATVSGIHKALEGELPPELKISGERTVSCYAEFVPVDKSNPEGPWRSVTGTWATGDIFGPAAEDVADRG